RLPFSSVFSQVPSFSSSPLAFLIGTVGGLMTTLHLPIKNAKGEELKDGTWEKTEEYGKRLARVAEKALAGAKAVTLTPFDARRTDVFIPVANDLYKVGWRVGVLERTFYLWEGD